MRRTIAFLACIAAAFAGFTALTWWVNPFGEAWDSANVRAAGLGPDSCLLSLDLVGPGSWFQFKEEIARQRRARTVVLGTSRVLELRSQGGETMFANLGLPGTGPGDLVRLLRPLESTRHLTVYIGADVFWFNTTWTAFGDYDGFHIRQIIGGQAFAQTLHLIENYPPLLFERRHRDTVGNRCVLDRGRRVRQGKVDAWSTDGSLVYRFQLLRGAEPASHDYERDLVRFETPYYGRWSGIDPGRLAELDRSLAWMRQRGWRVVGFISPYARLYADRLRTAAETAGPWRDYGRLVPAVFRRHGFPFLDLREARSVPCPDSAFIDDGWHPNSGCMARVRARLDAAAAKLP